MLFCIYCLFSSYAVYVAHASMRCFSLAYASLLLAYVAYDRLEDWSMGTKRSFNNYMEMVGLNTETKVATTNLWCHKGEWPEQVQRLSSHCYVHVACVLCVCRCFPTSWLWFMSPLARCNTMKLTRISIVYFLSGAAIQADREAWGCMRSVVWLYSSNFALLSTACSELS